MPEPRFLGAPRQKDFKYFLETHVRDCSNDSEIENMVKLCFSRRSLPGLEGAFWRFKDIPVVDDTEFKNRVLRAIKQSDRTLGAIAAITIEELVRSAGCSRACVKFPVDIRHVRELIEWFPNCRIVHITRDPRGLAMSKSNDPSGTALKVKKHPGFAWLIRKAALLHVVREYRVAARVHRQLRQLSNYRLFRYEDLLASPESTIRALCEFIDVDFSADMLEPQKGRHEHQPSSLTGRKQKAFDREAAVRWRNVISWIDNLMILALTRKSMVALDYEPQTHPIFTGAGEIRCKVGSRGGLHG